MAIPEGTRKVRFKGEVPPKWHYVTEAEYFALASEGKIVHPYDPDRPVLPWPDMSRTLIDSPDWRYGRFEHRLAPTTEEE